MAVTASSRNQAIELLRVAAALGIVIFHAHAPGYRIGYAGLIIFLILAPMFEVGVNWGRKQPPAALALSLLVPWLFWFLVYGCMNIARDLPFFPSENGIVAGILMGPSQHLWFLPFLFGVICALRCLKILFSPLVLFLLSVIGCFSLLLFTPWLRLAIVDMGSPYAQWLHAAPAVLLGVVLGTMDHVRHGRWILFPLLILLAHVALAGVAGLAIAYPLGFALVALALTIGPFLASTWKIESVSRLMLGVYLVHIAALMLFGFLAPEHAAWIVAWGAFFASVIGVWVARRYIPLARYIV